MGQLSQFVLQVLDFDFSQRPLAPSRMGVYTPQHYPPVLARHAWLEQEDNVEGYKLPSWKVLVDAVRSRNPALATRIEKAAPWCQ